MHIPTFSEFSAYVESLLTWLSVALTVAGVTALFVYAPIALFAMVCFVLGVVACYAGICWLAWKAWTYP